MTTRQSPRLTPPRLQAALGTLLLAVALAARAQAPVQDFDIPAGDLKPALEAWTTKTGGQIVYRDDDVKGRQTKGVKGRRSAQEALSELLTGTQIGLKVDKSGAVLLFPGEAPDGGGAPLTPAAGTPAPDPAPDAITITGHRVSHLGERNRTGTRTDTDPMELPQSVSTVSRGLIEDVQARDLGDALRSVAGVRAVQDNTSGFQIRGMEASLLINGSAGDATTGRAQTPTFAIESIEVVRGPEAVIGGQQGGYGGAINVITKVADGREVRSISLQAGDRSARMLGLDLGGSVDADRTLHYRLVASVERNGPTAAGTDGARRDYLAPSVAWEHAASGTAVTLEGVLDRSFSAAGVGVIPRTVLTDDLPPARYGPRSAGTTFNENRAGFTVSHRLAPGWSLRWKASRSALYLESTSVSLGLSTELGWPYVNPELSRFNAPLRLTEQRLELSGPWQAGDASHLLLAGLDSAQTRALPSDYRVIERRQLNLETGEDIDISEDSGYPLTLRFPTSVRRDRGLLLQDQWRWGEHWSGLLGYRWARGSSADENGDPADYRRGLPTWGLTYRPDEDLSLYVNHQQGFKSNANRRDRQGRLIPDETGRQFELGLKSQLAGRSIALTAALYRIAQRNVAQQDLGQLPSVFFVNVPGIRSVGGEVEASGTWRQAASWRANLSYTDARTTLDHQPVPYQPRLRFGAYGRYNLDGSDSAGPWLSADLQWSQGVAWADDSRGVTQPARSELTLNVGAGFVAGAWSLTAGVNNVLNRRLYEPGTYVIAQPRRVSATLRHAF